MTEEEKDKEENKRKSVGIQLHRCHWCGKKILKETIYGEANEEYTVICSDCLDWKLQENCIDIEVEIKCRRVKRIEWNKNNK